jgi:enoyl-CoA hydratase/carnithine racemase
MSDSVLVSTLKCARSPLSWGILTLNQEKSLNALTLEMIQSCARQLRAWEKDPAIVGVVLQGTGEKAFCAGGDIRMLYQAMQSVPRGKVVAGAAEFFRNEYDLDYLIHVYSKPVVCFGHGIVMGGGLGVFAGASHRVVSEKSMVAMPEITIGLYPDVGASWFLNRMPGRTGLYLGLTGTRLKAADCLFVGLADHYLERVRHNEVIPKLLEIDWQSGAAHRENHGRVSKLLKSLSSPAPASELRAHYDLIQELTNFESIQEIWSAFQAYSGSDEWIQAGRKMLLAGSPTSAAVIFEQLQRSRHLSLKECFDLEYTLSVQFAARQDFPEGVRALLIDKDLKPRWSPAAITDVNHDWVDAHFQNL